MKYINVTKIRSKSGPLTRRIMILYWDVIHYLLLIVDAAKKQVVYALYVDCGYLFSTNKYKFQGQ